MSIPFNPHLYQELAIDFMQKNPRCALFAGMGLGKTVSVLKTLDELELVEDVYPVLVIAPLRVARKTWRDEIAKWADFAGIRISQIVGELGEREPARLREAEIYTINYEQLPWLIDRYPNLADWPFRTIVADESSKLKNFRGSLQKHKVSGKRFVRVDSGKRTGALARVVFRSARFIELTGTPAPNGLVNLWSQLFFIDGGHRLGRTFGDFTARWFRPHPSGYGITPLPYAQEEIQAAIKDVCLTIDPADWFDLAAPIHRVIEVELPGFAMNQYRKMEREMYIEIEGKGVEALSAVSCTIKCLQLANGAIYTNDSLEYAELHDEKLLALQSIVDEAGGMPILVVYQFKSDLARLRRAFPTGRLLKTAKDEDDFKRGKIPILFVHPASAGHGIDGFQKATNIIVFFGQWWDLELRQQVIERIGPVRQKQSGMNRATFIYDIVSKDTIDELVLLRHETKRAVQDILLGALKRKAIA